jgi:DNA-binding NtrC family response regulator
MSSSVAPVVSPAARVPTIVGTSPVIQELRREIAAAARTHAKVLIVGETGVGKELVAQSIHAQSARSARSFVAVNCSGIPETLLASELFGHMRGSFTGAYRDKMGLVRQADRGTLFLDELGEMSLPMQAALLRFTETGEIQPVGADMPVGRTDVRLITATNRDLKAQIEAGAFREDLYYRLNVIQIRVPALRDRGDDILTLFNHYLTKAATTHRTRLPMLTRDAEQLLVAYPWPGNVRELKNVTERLVLREWSGHVGPDDLPKEVIGAATTGVAVMPVSSASVRETTHAWGSGSAADSFAPAGAGGDTPGMADMRSGAGGDGHRTANPETVAQMPQAAREHVAAESVVDRLWERLLAGEDFWSVVQQPFRARKLTRTDLASLIDRGLQHTNGSYRTLVRVFNLPPEDYKKFHAFLYQQNCNLPVAPYRHASIRARGYAGRLYRREYSAAC